MGTLRRILPLALLLLAFLFFILRAEVLSSLRDGLIVSDRPEPSDAAYILAGTPDLEPRTEKAANLYRAGLVPLILFIKDNTSGPWEPSFDRNLTFAERTKVILSSYGVPDSAVVALTADRTWLSKGTYEEAIAARKFVQERKIRSLILVTSPLHTRRARRTFREFLGDLSVNVLVVPATPESLDGPDVFSRKTGLRSPPEGMIRYEGLKNISLEYVKTGYYAVRFGWRWLMRHPTEVREHSPP